MTEKKETVETVKKESAKMYIGPTFKGVAYASVYTNGLPEPLAEKVEKYPLFAELIVDLDDLAAARKAKDDPESAISRCYAAAAEIIAKGE